MRRMLARGVLSVSQQVSIREFGDLCLANLGWERAAFSYPMRSWIDEGAEPAASPDAPVSTLDSFVNLYPMLTPQTHRGTVLGTGQRVTLAEAVQGCKRAGTYTRLAEGDRDRLAIGMQADIAGVGLHLFARDRMQGVGVRGHLTVRHGAALFARHGELAAAAA